MDLSNLSVAELRKLQERITQEMVKRERQELASARERILAIAQSIGVPLKDLIGSGIGTKTGAVAARYRNPDDASQTWTGRGRQPKWVKEWVESGKSLDMLHV